MFVRTVVLGSDGNHLGSSVSRWAVVYRSTTGTAPTTLLPTGAEATLAAGAGSITVTLSATDNGTPIDNWRVNWKKPSEDWTESTRDSTQGPATTYTITGLDASTEYEVRVRPHNRHGWMGASSSGDTWSDTVSATTSAATAPDKPGAPRLTAGNGEITASWSAPLSNGAEITGYDLQWRESPSGSWTDWSSEVTESPHTITGRTNGTAYEVRVRAKNSAGNSAYSDASQAATPKAPVPDAPAMPIVTVSVAGELSVSWNVPNDNGTAITGYNVNYKKSSAPRFSNWPHSGTSTSTTITGLETNTEYAITVSAESAAGKSWDSAWGYGTTATIPWKPVVTAERHDDMIEVSWEAYNGGAAINDYDVQYRQVTTPAGSWTEHTHTGTDRSTTISGTTANAGYEVRVRATNGAGTGDWSNVKTTLTKPEKPDVSVGPGPRELIVNWTAPPNGGAAISDYDVQYKASSETTWEDWSHDGTATKATITNLVNGRQYDIQVNATNSRGAGEWSETVTAIPGAPTKPDFLAIPGGNYIYAAWHNFSDNGDAVTGAKVQYKLSSHSAYTSVTYTGSNQYFFVDYVEDGKTYDVRVRLENSRCKGPWSNVKTLTVGTPYSPSVFYLRSGNAELTAYWAAPRFADVPALTSWTLQYRAAGDKNWTTADLPAESRNSTVTDLTNGTTYEVRLRASNVNGDGVWSDIESVTVGSPWEVILSLTAQNAALDLSWTEPTFAYGFDVIDYDIRYRISGAGEWSDWPHQGTERTATITGLENGTKYAVQVRAENTHGDGDWSFASSEVPGTPHAPVVTLEAGHERIIATWPEPYNSGFEITGYEIFYRESGVAATTPWTNAPHTGTGRRKTISGLTNGTSYDVLVRAKNEHGEGPWSAVRSETPEMTAPYPPSSN